MFLLTSRKSLNLLKHCYHFIINEDIFLKPNYEMEQVSQRANKKRISPKDQ